MPKQPADPNLITAKMLAKQLDELSRLRNEFERSKRECVGGEDSVSEEEFTSWLESFGHLQMTDDDSDNFPRYQRCMEAFGRFGLLANHIQFLPLLSPNSVVVELANMFPSLREAPGLEPFDEGVFADWREAEASPMAKHAAKLVLSVWENESHSFNLTEAFHDWDAEHREAYVAWFRRPLMPQRELWGKL